LPVGNKLAAMLNKMARSKLSEEKLKEKLNKYSRPQNCENLVGAKVNPEIWSKIRPETRSHDLKMQKIQNTILKAITPLAELSDSLLNLKSKNDVFDTAKAVRQILDSVALLTHANCDIIQRRRELIRPDLNKLYQQICAEHVSFTGFLFGDDLPQKIKDINMTNRVGQKLSGQEHKGSFNRNYYQNARAKQRWPKNDHRPYHRMHFAHKVHQVKSQFPQEEGGRHESQVDSINEVGGDTVSTKFNIAQSRPFNAGRIQEFFANWQNITSDRTVLDMVKGCTLEFATYPHHPCQPKEINFSSRECLAIKIELQRLLDKGIIITSEHETCEFISTIFVRPKADGSFRLILNLKRLNEHITIILKWNLFNL